MADVLWNKFIIVTSIKVLPCAYNTSFAVAKQVLSGLNRDWVNFAKRRLGRRNAAPSSLKALIVKKLHKQKMRGEQFSTQVNGYSTLDYNFCVASLITVWFKPKR